MATRFYLPSSGAAAVSPTIDSGQWSHINSVRRRMSPTKSNTSSATSVYTPDSADHLVAGQGHHVQFVSDIMPPQTISAQTIGVTNHCLEANAANNLFLTWRVWCVKADGSAATGTNSGVVMARRSDGTEMATSTTSRYDSATSTEVVVSEDFRLVLEIGVNGTPTATSGTQGHNATLRFGDANANDIPTSDSTSNSTYNPWLNFANTLLFYNALTATALTVASPEIGETASIAPARLEDWSGLNTTLDQDVGTSPSGAPYDRLKDDATNDVHSRGYGSTMAAGDCIFWVELKADTRSWCALYTDPAYGIFLDIANKAWGFESGTAVSKSLIDLGSGWVRAEIVVNVASADPDPIIYIATADATASYAGDGSGFFVGRVGFAPGTTYLPELEGGAAPGDHCTATNLTVGSPVLGTPAFDQPLKAFQGASLAVGSPKIGVEPSLYPSDQTTHSRWAEYAVTRTADVADGPAGPGTAEKIAEQAGVDDHQLRQASGLTPLVIGQQYTMWLEAKPVERSWIGIVLYDGADHRSNFNVSTGALGVQAGLDGRAIAAIGDGWYRCSITFTAGGANANEFLKLHDADNNNTYNGVAGSGVLFGRVGLNPGSSASFLPSLAQKHVLTAAALTVGSPEVGAPVLALTAALTAASLAVSSPVLGAPAIGSVHALDAASLAVGSPVLGAPSIAPIYNLAGAALAVGSPAFTLPAIGQQHALTAASLAVGSPVLGAPPLVIVTALAAQSLTVSAPALGTPLIAQGHILTGDSLAVGSPALGTPTIAQTHALAGAALTTGSPALGTPTLKEANLLAAAALTVASPVLGTPAVGQKHALAGTALDASSPALGTPSIGQQHVLTGTSLATAGPVIGAPAVAQAHILAGVAIAVGSPTLGAPALALTTALYADPIATASPAIGVPQFAQTHALLAAGIAPATEIGAPAFSERNALLAGGIATASPAIGQATVEETTVVYAAALETAAPEIGVAAAATEYAFVAVSLAVASPELGQPYAAMAAASLEVGPPEIGTAALAQRHSLAAAAMATEAPLFGTPFAGVVLRALALATGAPTIGAPALGLIIHLRAWSMHVHPALGAPAIGQSHVLVGKSVVANSPGIGAARLAQAHILAAAPVDAAAPAIGTPAFAAASIISAPSFVVAAAEIGAPVLAQTHDLAAISLATADPPISEPALGHGYALAAAPLAAGAPKIEKPKIGQGHALAGDALAVAAPVIGTPIFVGVVALAAPALAAGAPWQGLPIFSQINALRARPIVLPLELPRPILRQRQDLAAASLAATSPAISAGASLHEKHRRRGAAFAGGHPPAEFVGRDARCTIRGRQSRLQAKGRD